MSLDPSAWAHARAERYAYLTTTAFLVYEYFLQFGNEVELFWKKRWTFGKCLFLWSRYYSLGFNINNAITFLNEHPSYDVRSRFFHWQNTGAALQVVTTHIILELRIYAMYGSTRTMLCVLSALMAIEVTLFGVIFGLQRPGLVATNNPSPDLYICADGDPPHVHWIMYYWIVSLILDSILLSLSLYKGWQSQRSGIGGSLMRTLTRDSVLYFVVIFCVYLANMMFWYINVLTLDEVGTSFAFTVSAVLANRLLITVREKYYSYRKELEDMESFTSMHFQSAPPRTRREGETIAMDTFADATTTAQSRWDNITVRVAHEYGLEQYSESRGF